MVGIVFLAVVLLCIYSIVNSIYKKTDYYRVAKGSLICLCFARVRLVNT